MKYLKLWGLMSFAAAVMGLIIAVPASATIIESSSGTQYKTGTSIRMESEGTMIVHPPFGAIECQESALEGKTTNEGGSGVNVVVQIEAFSWSKCNSTVDVLKIGTLLTAVSSTPHGTVTVSGTEVTSELLGFHCIYGTSNTKLGTLTGGTPATLHIEAFLPRTGGKSGAFCGSTGQWTGAYKVTSPSSLRLT